MTELHKFTIRAPLDARDTVIEIDGIPLSGVCRVAFDINSSSHRQIVYLEVAGEALVEGGG